MDDYLDLIKSFEGYSPRPYGDYKQTSIGYGTRAQPGDAYLSREEADARLRAEAAKVTAFIDSQLPGIDDTKKAALTSFGYNLGTGAGGLSDLIPDAKAGNWNAVADRMQHYNHVGGEVNDGLTQRRAQEASILTGGAMPNAAQLTAEALRKRFGAQPEARVIEQTAPEQARQGGDRSLIDRLVGAFTGSGGNPQSRLEQANAMINAGRSARVTSPWELVGALAQQGSGLYMKRKAEDELKAKNDELVKSMSGATDTATLARAMIASGDPKYQVAGATLLAQSMGPKAAPDVKTVKTLDQWGRTIETPVTFNQKTGKYEPMKIGGGGQTQQPMQSTPTQQPAPMQQTAPEGNDATFAVTQQSGAAPVAAQPQQPQGGVQYLGEVGPSTAQPAQPAQPAQQQAALIPEGMVSGPAAPKELMSDGYMHKTSPSGGFLWQNTPQGLQPVFEPKAEVDARSRIGEKRTNDARETQAMLDKAAKSFSGGIDRFGEVIAEVGKPAFERAVGPWQSAGSSGDKSGFWGSGVSLESVGRLIPQAYSEIQAYMAGGATPTEVRDRIDAVSKNLAAVMKPLVRKPGEGTWTDKDQENLEAQIGDIKRSRSTEEAFRRLDDLRKNSSQILGVNIPEPKYVGYSKDAPSTVEPAQQAQQAPQPTESNATAKTDSEATAKQIMASVNALRARGMDDDSIRKYLMSTGGKL
jgi:lysozyme